MLSEGVDSHSAKQNVQTDGAPVFEQVNEHIIQYSRAANSVTQIDSQLGKISAVLDLKVSGDENRARTLAATAIKKVEFFLLGPFSVMGPNAENLTPSTQKSKAILAFVVTSNRGMRSRAWICDKLWSDRAPEQALASLRQALCEIRKALGSYCEDLLTIDKFNVSINLEAVSVDLDLIRVDAERSELVYDKSLRRLDADFLEGMDICDPEFEDWLSVERIHWDNVREEVKKATKRTTTRVGISDNPQTTETSPQFYPSLSSICILPPIYSNGSADERWFATSLTNIFVQNIKDVDQVDLLDLRDEKAVSESDAVWQTAGVGKMAALRFRVRTFWISSNLVAEIQILNVRNSKLEWFCTLRAPDVSARDSDNTSIVCQMGHAAEAALTAISRIVQETKNDPELMARMLILGAVDDIFDIGRAPLQNAEAGILASLELVPSAQAFAWLAFISTFKVGQNIATLDGADRDKTEYLVRRSLELDPNNALSLALCAHVFSYVFHNHDHATDLYVKSLKINPHRALTWDLFSVLHAYIGMPNEGLKCAKWARQIGLFNPHSFYFDTSCCINASLSGRHSEAVEFGIKVINCKPNFNPALRFMLSSLGHLGDQVQSESCLERLLAIEPDFSISSYENAAYATIHNDQRDVFLKGLELAGVSRSAS